MLALRPERLEIAATPLAGVDNSLPGKVEFVSYLGAASDVHVRLSPSDRVIVQLANRGDGFAPEIGATVHIGWSAAAARLFPAESVGHDA